MSEPRLTLLIPTLERQRQEVFQREKREKERERERKKGKIGTFSEVLTMTTDFTK